MVRIGGQAGILTIGYSGCFLAVGHFFNPHNRHNTLSHCSESEQKGIKESLSVFGRAEGHMSSGKD